MFAYNVIYLLVSNNISNRFVDSINNRNLSNGLCTADADYYYLKLKLFFLISYRLLFGRTFHLTPILTPKKLLTVCTLSNAKF